MAIKVDIKGLKNLKTMLRDIVTDLSDATEDYANDLARNALSAAHLAMRDSIPNAPLTVKLKGHGIQFLDTGTYLTLFNIYKQKLSSGDLNLFVGIPSGVTNKRGYLYTDIAKILEYGAFVPITDKTRRFFDTRFAIELPDYKYAFRIPPRPHIRVMNAYVYGQGRRDFKRDMLRAFGFLKKKSDILFNNI